MSNPAEKQKSMAKQDRYPEDLLASSEEEDLDDAFKEIDRWKASLIPLSNEDLKTGETGEKEPSDAEDVPEQSETEDLEDLEGPEQDTPKTFESSSRPAESGMIARFDCTRCDSFKNRKRSEFKTHQLNCKPVC